MGNANKKLFEFETFREIGFSQTTNLLQNKPSSFNYNVRIKKYKIIVEEIIEPHEMLCYRLERLWVTENNWHQYEPLKNEAKN